MGAGKIPRPFFNLCNMETLISIKTDAANKTVTINEASGGKPEHAVYSARIEDGNLILINSVTTQKRFSAPFNTVLIDGATYQTEAECMQHLSNIGSFKQGGGAIPVIYNHAGQIKVNYNGLQISNVTANQQYELPLHTATPTVVGSPTTQYPTGSETTYNPAMFIPGDNPPTTMRLRENNIPGQTHRWRIIGSYENKAQGNNGELQFLLVNPDSGFYVTDQITLPSDKTAGTFTIELMTIADDASLAVGRGYLLKAVTSFTDNNLVVKIDSITRISFAVENQ